MSFLMLRSTHERDVARLAEAHRAHVVALESERDHLRHEVSVLHEHFIRRDRALAGMHEEPVARPVAQRLTPELRSYILGFGSAAGRNAAQEEVLARLGNGEDAGAVLNEVLMRGRG